MTKKHFVALADMIKDHNKNNSKTPFNMEHMEALATLCKQENVNFKHERWIDYILGTCGKNGGQVKGVKS